MHLFSPFDTHLNMCCLYMCNHMQGLMPVLCKACTTFKYLHFCVLEREKERPQQETLFQHFFFTHVHGNLDWVSF